ncbi:MAG: hypothetical protein AB8H86_14235 [Polyangiales bacterium]
MTFIGSFIVFDDSDLSSKFLFGAMAWLVLSLVSALPIFSARRRTIEVDVGLNGIRAPHTFIGFERLVSVQVPNAASLVLLTDNGDKLTLALPGHAEEAAALIEKRREVHARLTRTVEVATDGYRNVRVHEGVDGDLVEAMRDAGMGEGEVAECLALAHSGHES